MWPLVDAVRTSGVSAKKEISSVYAGIDCVTVKSLVSYRHGIGAVVGVAGP